MNRIAKTMFTLFVALLPLQALVAGVDPTSVVAEWSNSSTYKKIIDINFSDETWPDTWVGETGRDCPSFSDSCYVNAVIDVPANGGTEVKYPVLFHHCTFATKKSSGGFAGATAAFCRQYYLGEPAEPKSLNDASKKNNWTVPGHTKYLEDNIRYDDKGTPIYGEAGFVQMCRDAYYFNKETRKREYRHGWMEIDHIPYVERVQWSWSSTSAFRGIKCDIKIGDGDWKPLVWMGSDDQNKEYTAFSDQGYFMENVINASDVSLRWRVWDGDNSSTLVQVKEDGTSVFNVRPDSTVQRQAPRVHKIQIFGNEITAEQAAFAKANPLKDVGTLTDLSGIMGGNETPAPDDNAEVVAYTVAKDGSGDYTTVQSAIDAVKAGQRGIIYIKAGIYEENIYAGTKTNKDKFISLIGENKETTILTSSVDRGSANTDKTYLDCSALNVFTDRFYAENLTIRNTAGNVGQAEALYTNGDAHIFNNCYISGYQDTYKANSGARGYFTNCTIEGATDFIYDSGLEWFDDCEIRSVKGSGYLTAAGKADVSMTKAMYPDLSVSPFYAGLFFRNCTLTAEDGVADGSYYLGRPWGENCGTMFIQCTLGNHINKAGWTKMGEDTWKTCSFLEYKNKDVNGNLADVSGRVDFGHQATDAEVAAYMTPEFMFAKASEVPFNYKKILNGAARPMNFAISDTEITWEGDDNTAAFIVYKDGAFAGITIEPIGFLTITGTQVKLLPVNPPTTTIDRVVEMVPEAVDKVSAFITDMKEKSKAKKEAAAEAESEDIAAQAAEAIQAAEQK